MLIEIYLFLTIAAFVTFITGVVSKKKEKEITEDAETDSEVRGNIPLLLMSAVIFFFLAFTSLDIDYMSCHNQIVWMNNTAENDTQITNQISCNTETIIDQPLSNVQLGMGILSSLLAIFFVITLFRTSLPKNR